VLTASSGFDPTVVSDGQTVKAKQIEFSPKGGTAKATGESRTSVPGAVAGWDAMNARFGTLPLSEDLTPAIYYASEGVPITELVSKVWAHSSRAFLGKPGFAKTFLISGHAPVTGEIFRNPDLATSLRVIAEHGSDGFSRGPLAATLVDLLTEQGSLIRADDIAEYQPE